MENNINENIKTIKDNVDKLIRDINEGKNFMELLEVKKLHDKGIKGNGVKVAIIDNNFTNGHGFMTHDVLTQVIPEAEIMKISVKEYKSEKDMYCIADALQKCIDNNVRVINLSIGVSKLVGDLKQEYVNAFKALERKFKEVEDSGIISVCAAGNNGYSEENQIDYPAAFKSTISVGSVNKNKEWSNFSDVNEFVDFVTYGENVELSNGRKVTGTSFAAPITTGIITLMLQQRPELKKVDVIDLLKRNAEDLGTIGRDKAFGYGFIKAIEVPDDYTIKNSTFLGDKNFLKEQYGVEELFSKGIYGNGVKIGILGYGCSDVQGFNIKEFKNVSHDSKGENTIDFGGSEDYANAIISPVLSTKLGLCPKSENYIIKDRSSYGGLSIADVNKAYLYYKTADLDIAIVMPWFNPDGLKFLANKGIICIMPCFKNDSTMQGMVGQNTGNFNVLTVGQINPDMTLDNNSYVCENMDCVGFGYGYGYETLAGVKISNEKTLVSQSAKTTAAAIQVAGIVALLKPQNPNLKNANDIRKLLPKICKQLPYSKEKVGHGLIQAKLI